VHNILTTASQWRHYRGTGGDTRTERNFCGQIYKELWTNEVGEVKKVQGDTIQRVTDIKIVNFYWNIYLFCEACACSLPTSCYLKNVFLSWTSKCNI